MNPSSDFFFIFLYYKSTKCFKTTVGVAREDGSYYFFFSTELQTSRVFRIFARNTKQYHDENVTRSPVYGVHVVSIGTGTVVRRI